MTEEQQLTPEERRRNVRRAKEVERHLGEVQNYLGLVLYYASSCMDDLRAEREALRAIFGMEPLGEMAPLYRTMVEAAARAREELAK